MDIDLSYVNVPTILMITAIWIMNVLMGQSLMFLIGITIHLLGSFKSITFYRSLKLVPTLTLILKIDQNAINSTQ